MEITYKIFFACVSMRLDTRMVFMYSTDSLFRSIVLQNFLKFYFINSLSSTKYLLYMNCFFMYMKVLNPYIIDAIVSD